MYFRSYNNNFDRHNDEYNYVRHNYVVLTVCNQNVKLYMARGGVFMNDKFRLNCNIPTSLNEDLERVADDIGLPKTSIVVLALRKYVDEHDIVTLQKKTLREKNG